VSDIHIEREHALGLAGAREVAGAWVEQAEREFELRCTVIEGEHADTVEFMRSGVSGELRVTSNRFDLHARLGLLLGAFSPAIRREIEKNLDVLLGATVAKARPHAQRAKTHSAAAKKAARKR
jgi:putative polyhydroxyalkanoate system protein